MANTILGVFGKGGGEDPLADVKALALWIAEQPANDHLGIVEAMVRVLEDMGTRQPRATSKRVAAVLELDRLSLPSQARLRKQFLQPSLSDSVRQRLWHASDDLARWFAYTYENLFGGLQEFFFSWKAKGQLPGVAARMFWYRGEQAKNSLFQYERWIASRWRGLHAGYEAALKCGVAGAWRMHDGSESGCKLVSRSGEAAQPKLGSLVGIQDEGDTRWKLGIVRRLKKFSGGQTELGVATIARHAALIAPKPVASRDTGYSVDGIDVSVEGRGFDAVYLPPMQTPGRTPRQSVVVPAPEYGERRRFMMVFNSRAYTIEFTTALERTKEWAWTEVDIVPQAP